jgi:[acyl-carrier-protein] S-malonyltransferase
MVVSPGRGTFHRAQEAGGAESFEAGDRIGEVAGPQDNATVTAAQGGVVVEWLVEDGDLVSPGQPLLRLQPEVGF